MASPRQLDLLNDWTPPAATVAFDDSRVRAANVHAQISRMVAAALTDARTPREEIATRMTAFLGERITKHMLDAYASQARAEHTIPLHRFIALIHATGDRRLLQSLAERMGWAVIDNRHLPLIELAAVQERERELRAHADSLRRQARSRGSL